jgi:hypothetical protein
VNAINNLPIRIYPLSELEFKDMVSAKIYFESGLKEKYGQFRYRRKAIRAKSGTIILFQYDKKIIAQARLVEVCKYNQPMIDDNVEYHGHFLLNLDNICYYEEALSAEVFYKIYPDKHLGRVTHILDNEERNSRLLKKLSEL